MRLNANGTLDTTFGTSGWVNTPVGSLNDNYYAIAVEPSGSIAITGTSQIANSYQLFGLVQYTSSGALDTTFNGTGIVLTQINGSINAYPAAMALESDGKIFVAGNVDSQGTLVRFNTNGSIDTTFGTSGYVKLPVVSGSYSAFGATLVQPDGKVLAGGASRWNNHPGA